MDWNSPQLRNKISDWICEDIGNGDLTQSSITENIGKACWIAKEDGIFCGIELLKIIFNQIDQNINLNPLIKDGQNFKKNQMTAGDRDVILILPGRRKMEVGSLLPIYFDVLLSLIHI